MDHNALTDGNEIQELTFDEVDLVGGGMSNGEFAGLVAVAILVCIVCL